MPQPKISGKTTGCTVRPANIHDVPTIFHLVETYANMGNLLPRQMHELYRHLRDFFVIEENSNVIACGALEIFTESLGEVRSLVVDDAYKGKGYGKLLVQRIIEEAKAIGLTRLMALTYVAQFFENLGFKKVAKETIPEKVWGICRTCYKYNKCDETAVLLELT